REKKRENRDKIKVKKKIVAKKQETVTEKKEEFSVQGDHVEGKVDYNKLCAQFGCDLVTQNLLERFEKLTKKKPHEMIRRGLYYAHRDFDKILDAYEKGEPFYLYTGRGPSSESMHLGHTVPFIINKHLQEAFNVPLVIQITDDEKFFLKEQIKTIEEAYRLARENAKDIIAMGFDITKTFIFIDTDYIKYLYPNTIRVQEKITYSQMKAIFGVDDSSNIGKIAYPPIQTVPAFSSTFAIPFGNKKMKCLIPCAIDQDPYFRLCRDVAPKLNEEKPSCLYSKFMSSLRGPKGKMSASDENSAIYLSDSPKQIRDKIMKHAFSGGQDTEEKQSLLGADLDSDVSYQYLTFFLKDDKLLHSLGNDYKSGKLQSSHIKSKLCDILIPFVLKFQENRKLVTDDILEAFMAIYFQFSQVFLNLINRKFFQSNVVFYTKPSGNGTIRKQFNNDKQSYKGRVGGFIKKRILIFKSYGTCNKQKAVIWGFGEKGGQYYKAQYFTLLKLKKNIFCLVLGKSYENPTEVVDLKVFSSVKSSEDSTNKKHSFDVYSTDMRHSFVATSESEKEDWIRHIGKAIVLTNKKVIPKTNS
ncbi:tryptophanyl-tRNA synthetase, partial [Reticulomyxa filosa]